MSKVDVSRSPSHTSATLDGEAGDVEKVAEPNSAQELSNVTEQKVEKDQFRVELDESERPTSLPPLRKWLCLLVICAGAVNVTSASSMTTSTFPHIEKEFHVGIEVAILSLSLFIFGVGLGPLLFGGLSEFLGRNVIYRWPFILFVIFNFPVAFAPNIVVHLVFRFITGFFGAAFLTLGGGTIADLFQGPGVATPVAIFTLSPFLGPITGPIISGFVNQNVSWRWTFHVLTIWSFFQAVALHFIPETHAPTLTNQKAARLRAETGDNRYYSPFDAKDRSLAKTLKLSLFRPFQLMTHELMILLLNIWTSLELAIVYMTFSVYPVIFSEVHGFNQAEVGLAFIGLGGGMVVATLTQPIWLAIERREIAKYAAKGEKPPPESVLYMAMAAAILSPLGLYMFAFTVYKQVHWIFPIILIMPFGTSVVFSFTSTNNFFVRSYRPYAASAMASNSFMRSSLSAALPLASRPMFRAMTNTGAIAFLAGVMTLLAPVPFIFFKYGPRLRKHSKFAV